ncbi:hypothetical protein AB6D40_022895 [Vibrio cyclitrophicus]
MPVLPSSGVISIDDIATEFSCERDLLACAVAAGLPTTNIKMSDFYGKSAEVIYEWYIGNSADSWFYGFQNGEYGAFTPTALENPAGGTTMRSFMFSALNSNLEFTADSPVSNRTDAKRYMVKITPTEVSTETLPVLYLGVPVANRTYLEYNQYPMTGLPQKVTDRITKWKSYAMNNLFARVKLKVEFVPAWDGQKMNSSGAQGKVLVDGDGMYDLSSTVGFTTTANHFLNGVGAKEDLGTVYFGRYSDADLTDYDKGTGGAMAFEFWHRFNAGLITVTLRSGGNTLVVSSANGWAMNDESSNLTISHPNGTSLVGTFLRAVGNGGTVHTTVSEA